jgi:diguanylate cyclase (GGDEF)-like protein
VLSVLEDHEGSLWVGTQTGGLNRLVDGNVTTYTRNNGLTNDLVMSVFEDEDGTLWLGTLGGGINFYKNGVLSLFERNHELPSQHITSVLKDSDGVLWAGTLRHGVCRFDEKGIKIFSTREGLTNNMIRCLFEDNDRYLWVGTDNGLNRIKNDNIETFRVNEGLSHNTVMSICQDSEGNFWIGTEKGLTRYNRSGFTTFSDKDGLSGNRIQCLYCDSEKNLWIGTGQNGLNLYKDGRFFSFTTRDNLHNDMIVQVIDDDQGGLWLGSAKGIFKIDKSQLINLSQGKTDKILCYSYTTADGMKSNDCSGGVSPTVVKGKDGKLWFPTTGGVSLIDPEDITYNSIPPKVIVEYLVVDGQRIDLWDVNNPKKLIIPPGKKRFEFYFTALSFIAPNRIRFRHMLDKYDSKTVESGTLRTAQYTKIPPGEYTFSVYACNNDGMWNQKGASITFRLKPYFYQTIWFYAICILSVLGIGLLAFGIRLRRLKKQAEHLTRLVNKRTRELHIRNEELEAIDRMVKTINKEIELNKLLKSILKQALNLFSKAERGSILLLDKKTGLFKVAAYKNYEAKIKKLSFEYDEAIKRYTEGTKQLEEGVYIIRDFKNRAGKEKIKGFPVPKSMLAMTMEIDNKLEGFLVLDNMSDPDAFDHSDLKKLQRFREHAITALIKARTHKKLEEAAITDPLTGLFNRRRLNEIILNESYRFDRSKKAFTLIICDIDNFKLINDKCGHDCGDYILEELAKLMRASIRKQDVVGRYGGEEFLFLLPDTPLEAGKILGEKIRAAIETHDFKFSKKKHRVTVTLGLAEYNRKMDIDLLIKKADEALYTGKQNGRNQVVAGN